MNKTTKDAGKILERAKQILSKKGGWTRGVFARDVKGSQCAFTSPEACSFCFEGAVRRAAYESKLEYYNSDSLSAVWDTLKRDLSVNMVYFNDNVAKDKRYVIRKIEQAIKRLKKGM